MVFHQNHPNSAEFAEPKRVTLEHYLHASMRNVFAATSAVAAQAAMSNKADDEIGIELRRAATQALEEREQREQERKRTMQEKIEMTTAKSNKNKKQSQEIRAKNNNSHATYNSNNKTQQQEQEEAKETETNSNGKDTKSRGKSSKKKKTKHTKEKEIKNREVIYFNTFCKLMRLVRPDLRKQFKTQKAELEQIRYMYLAMANASSPKYDNGINYRQFRDIDHFIEMEIWKDVARSKRYAILAKSQFIESRLISLGRGNTPFNSDQTSANHANSNDTSENHVERAKAGLTNMSELLTMDFGDFISNAAGSNSNGSNTDNNKTDNNNNMKHVQFANTANTNIDNKKHTSQGSWITKFQHSLHEADLSFGQLCKYLCDCRFWSRQCVVETFKKYWYKMRLALIIFWEWDTQGTNFLFFLLVFACACLSLVVWIL